MPLSLRFHCPLFVWLLILGDFTKRLQTVNVSFVMPACLSVYPFARLSAHPSIFLEKLDSHWTDVCQIFYWIFPKICRENSILITNHPKVTRTVHEDLYKLIALFRWILLLLLRKVSDEINTQTFQVEHIFPENCAVYEIIKKDVTSGQAIDYVT
jgi:hypothetical protein